MDVKVDHNLSSNNRFFGRYSYEKTHRLLPATLPHGDAGTTFGAGDGNIKAQSFAFNDTQTMSSNWLNEFRFGWSSIKFLNTSIDYGTNPAKAVGLPGINLNTVTSAMSQMQFQNIRNLGANGNQPLITNQNDFQFFDNVTWLKGKHTLKAGGSLTLRSREILNADSITGHLRLQQQQHVELRGHHRRRLHGRTARPGFDVASFLLGIGSQQERAPCSTRGPTPRSGRKFAHLRAGRLPRQQQADVEPRACGGTSTSRGLRSTTSSRTSTRRPASSSSRRLTARPLAA